MHPAFEFQVPSYTTHLPLITSALHLPQNPSHSETQTPPITSPLLGCTSLQVSEQEALLKATRMTGWPAWQATEWQGH